MVLISPELYKAYGRFDSVVLIGCRASGAFGDYCEFDLLIPFERFNLVRERRGGDYFDLHFIPWEELEGSELAQEVALGSFKVIRDEDWALSPYIYELSCRREEVAKAYAEKKRREAEESLMRVHDALEFGDELSASYWLYAATYSVAEAYVSRREVVRRSHILAQLRGCEVYGRVSELLRLTMGSKVTAWRRLDALRCLAEHVKRRRLKGRGLAYLHIDPQGLRMEEERGIKMVRDGRVAELYASLGMLLVKGLKEIYVAECEKEGVRPYYERIAKELVKVFGLEELVFKLSGFTAHREEVEEGLKELRGMLRGLGERAS